MSVGTVLKRLAGMTGHASWFNDWKTALVQDILPMDTSGDDADLAGSIGNSSFRFTTAYLQKLVLGSAATPTTIQAPTLAADFGYALPSALPGAKSTVITDASGNISFGPITANEIVAQSLTQIKLQARSVHAGTSGDPVPAGGIGISASSGGGTVGNLSVIITTTGRPVKIAIQPDGSGITTWAAGSGNVLIYRDATALITQEVDDGPEASPYIRIIDNTVAGTYTYSVQVSGAPCPPNCVLAVYEL